MYLLILFIRVFPSDDYHLATVMRLTLCLLFHAIGLLLVPGNALKNYTFDDTDEAFITYSINGYWKGKAGGMGLGTHKASTEWYSYAFFNFTGVAVYYWAPLFNNVTIIDFSVDGGPSSSISLRDPDAPEGLWAPTTKPSKVMTFFKDLEYGNHTLKISHDRFRSNGVVVDYFEVTTLDSDGTPSPINSPGGSSKSPSPTSQIPSKSSPSSNLTNIDSTTQDNDWKTKFRELERSFKVAVGVISTILGLLICCAILAYWKCVEPWMKSREKSKKGQTDSVSSTTKDVEKDLARVDLSGQGKDVKSISSDSDGTEGVVSVLDGSKGQKVKEPLPATGQTGSE